MNWIDYLDSFPEGHVAVVGDVMLDEYIWGNASRISPEAPVPVVEVTHHTYVAGGAANIVALGGQATLFSVVGADPQADQLDSVLGESGIDATNLVMDDTRPTTTKKRVIAQNQQIVRLDNERKSPISSAIEQAVLQRLSDQMPFVDAIVISDYAKGLVTKSLCSQVIALAHKNGKPIIVDPKGQDYTKYAGATAITPNAMETSVATGCIIQDETGLQEAADRLLALLKGTQIVITRGAQGMSLFRKGESPLHIRAVAHNVYDVTGAGDTVLATLVLGLIAGLPMERALHLANDAAGIVVCKFGTATVSLQELREAILQNRRQQSRLQPTLGETINGRRGHSNGKSHPTTIAHP